MRDHEGWMHVEWLLIPFALFAVLFLLDSVAKKTGRSRLSRCLDRMQTAAFHLMTGWFLVWAFQWAQLMGNALYHALQSRGQA